MCSVPIALLSLRHQLGNAMSLSCTESAIAQTGCRHADEEGVLLAGICCPHCCKLALSKWTLGIWVALTTFKPLSDGNPWLVQNCWGRFHRNTAALLTGAGVCSNVRGGLMHHAPPSPPWDMAGYVWLPQETYESYLHPPGLLLCIALPPGPGENMAVWEPLHPSIPSCAQPSSGAINTVSGHVSRSSQKKTWLQLHSQVCYCFVHSSTELLHADCCRAIISALQMVQVSEISFPSVECPCLTQPHGLV